MSSPPPFDQTWCMSLCDTSIDPVTRVAAHDDFLARYVQTYPQCLQTDALPVLVFSNFADANKKNVAERLALEFCNREFPGRQLVTYVSSTLAEFVRHLNRVHSKNACVFVMSHGEVLRIGPFELVFPREPAQDPVLVGQARDSQEQGSASAGESDAPGSVSENSDGDGSAESSSGNSGSNGSGAAAPEVCISAAAFCKAVAQRGITDLTFALATCNANSGAVTLAAQFYHSTLGAKLCWFDVEVTINDMEGNIVPKYNVVTPHMIFETIRRCSTWPIADPRGGCPAYFLSPEARLFVHNIGLYSQTSDFLGSGQQAQAAAKEAARGNAALSVKSAEKYRDEAQKCVDTVFKGKHPTSIADALNAVKACLTSAQQALAIAKEATVLQDVREHASRAQSAANNGRLMRNETERLVTEWLNGIETPAQPFGQ